MSIKRERETKHRGNHCLPQTLTESCIRTSFPASIILPNGPFFARTHSCSVLSLCVNNSLLCRYHKIVQRAKSGRKDAHSYLNPRGYLSILPTISKLNCLLLALKPASFIFLLAFQLQLFSLFHALVTLFYKNTASKN